MFTARIDFQNDRRGKKNNRLRLRSREKSRVEVTRETILF